VNETRDEFIGNMTWMYDFNTWAGFTNNDNAEETAEEKLMFGCVEESEFDPAEPKPICHNARLFDINLKKVIKPYTKLTDMLWNQADMCMIIRTMIANAKVHDICDEKTACKQLFECSD